MRSGRGSLRSPADTWRLPVRELSAFGLVGGVCFLLDVALFHLLCVRLGAGPVEAKAVATLATATVAFAGHRSLTFGRRPPTPVGRGSLRFAAVNGTTLLLGLSVLALVRYGLGLEDALVLQLANLAGIALGTAVRLGAYRRWVFPAAPPG